MESLCKFCIFPSSLFGFFSPHLLWYFNYNAPIETSVLNLSNRADLCLCTGRSVLCSDGSEFPNDLLLVQFIWRIVFFLEHFSMNIFTTTIRKERLCLTALNLKTTQSVPPLCLGVFSLNPMDLFFSTVLGGKENINSLLSQVARR